MTLGLKLWSNPLSCASRGFCIDFLVENLMVLMLMCEAAQNLSSKILLFAKLTTNLNRMLWDRLDITVGLTVDR